MGNFKEDHDAVCAQEVNKMYDLGCFEVQFNVFIISTLEENEIKYFAGSDTDRAFAYFKNFFDRITADLSFYYKCNPRDNKPNYNAFYKDRTLVAFYTEIYNSEVIIKTAHKLRNANPISHASSELLDRNSTTRDLKQSIDDLTKIIFDYVGFRMK